MVIEERDIERIEQSLGHLSEKMDTLGDRYLSRTEYEARHATLQAEIAKISLEVAQKNAWAITEHESIKKETDRKFEKFSETLDKIEEKFSEDTQELRIEIAKVSTDKWKLVAMTLIGALTSGGILGIIDVFRSITGH